MDQVQAGKYSLHTHKISCLGQDCAYQGFINFLGGRVLSPVGMVRIPLLMHFFWEHAIVLAQLLL